VTRRICKTIDIFLHLTKTRLADTDKQLKNLEWYAPNYDSHERVKHSHERVKHSMRG
jgi:hypothetical protein